MSIFTRIKEYFTPKTIFVTVPPSELSDPIAVLKEETKKTNQEHKMKVLRELARYVTPVCSHDFLKDTGIWSADKRLSELKKDGLCTMELRREWNANRGYWLINENWLKALWMKN